jgi:hypothetical protein
MASSKRRRNKKRHARERKRRAAEGKRGARSASPPSVPTLPVRPRPLIGAQPSPSELDQIHVFIAEPELGRPETTLSDLRRLASDLPFEPAMLMLALLNLRVESVLREPAGHWQLAQEFYEGDSDLLQSYAHIVERDPHAFVFSPQAIAFLMRILIDNAREEPLRELNAHERRTVQRAVLGAHSVLESSLDETEWPDRSYALAFELQAATYFHRPSYLEEMARHDELLRLAADDPRLIESDSHVPVRDWLATYGLTADEQWSVGFGLAAMTRAFDDAPRPRALATHVDDLLAKLGLPDASRELPVISASRSEYQEQFAALGSGDATLAWELRPFKLRPFLRLASGDLLLLGRPWLLSWLGEGFHYRALLYAEQLEPRPTLAYLTYVGAVVERYALDLAEATFKAPQQVFGEQRYRTSEGDAFTSDVAVVSGEDLVLFEIHARRVAATAAVSGDAFAATTEVSRLLVGKAEQLGGCVRALIDGDAALPSLDIAGVRRIWPIVVSMAHIMQSSNLWEYLRQTIDPDKTRAFQDERVQPLQVLTVDDYEKLLGLVQAGNDLVAMLSQRASGPFRERDFAAWLHGDPKAPSDTSRHPVLEVRWESMAKRAVATADMTIGLKPEDSENRA